MLFERYRFNRRVQEAGKSYEHYRMALRKIAESCHFDTITPEEILRDRLVFGICDTKVKERLLRESGLTLAKTDEMSARWTLVTLAAHFNVQTCLKHVKELFSRTGNKKKTTKHYKFS